MISASQYNNALIEGNWSITLPKTPNDKPSLWHYCPKAKVIRVYNAVETYKIWNPLFVEKENSLNKKTMCIDCKEEPSEEFICTFNLLNK